MAAAAELPQFIDVLRVKCGLGEMAEADDLRDEQSVSRVGLGLADVEAPNRIRLHWIDDLNEEPLPL